MPMDMWLYNYAIKLHNARWEFYNSKSSKAYNPPPIPIIPKNLPCKSTRFILSCKSGKMGVVKYISPKITEIHKEIFSTLLKLQ